MGAPHGLSHGCAKLFKTTFRVRKEDRLGTIRSRVAKSNHM
jgi:hypothetical protein